MPDGLLFYFYLFIYSLVKNDLFALELFSFYFFNIMIFIFFHYGWFTVFYQFSAVQHITYIWSLIYGTNEPFHRKRKSWTWRIDLCLLKRLTFFPFYILASFVDD